MSQNKRSAFYITTFVIFLLLIDTALYASLFLINKKRNLFYDRTNVSEKRIEFWLSNSFDSQLGWNLPANEQNNLGARRIENYSAKPKYKMKMFGESFVYGSDVKLEETIAALIEKETPWDCLNYGVGSFGTDQAFLKYKYNAVPTDYVVLGILSENIGRVVSYYKAFYMREWSPPKPRFVKQEGEIRLLSSPIVKKEDAFKLLDKNYVHQLKMNDYWSQYYEKVLKAPPQLQWPATWMVIKHWPFFYKRISLELKKKISPNFSIEAEKYKYSHLYQSQSEAMEIMEYIVDQFVQLAKEQGEHPIIVIFPDQFSMDLMKKYDQKIYSPLERYIESKGYDYVDFGSLFKLQDYPSFYNYYNGHYSPKGNQFVAHKLINYIQILESNSI